MNRAERRRLAKQGKKVASNPVYNVKASDTQEAILRNPIAKQIIDQEINRILLEKDKQYAIDVDAMVMWALRTFPGLKFGPKRLRKFYIHMFREHYRMRTHYEMQGTYPERYKLKEMGVDLQAWYDELFDESGNYKNPEVLFNEQPE